MTELARGLVWFLKPSLDVVRWTLRVWPRGLRNLWVKTKYVRHGVEISSLQTTKYQHE